MSSDSTTCTGSLWRDTVNFLGDGEVTPQILMPLLERVASRPRSDGYFLARMRECLRRPEDRAEVEQEIALTAIGHRIWTEQRDALHAWANRTEHGPITEDELTEWWTLRRDPHGILVDETERWQEFLGAIGLTAAERAVTDGFLEEGDGLCRVLIRQMHRQLKWLDDLDWLRELASKTWPADAREREFWTTGDLAFVDEYFSDQQPELVAPDEDSGKVNPFALQQAYREQNLGFGLDGLEYCMYVLMRSAVIDFVNDVLESSRFPGLRGSMRCVECGQYVQRHPRGYGQLYCGDRCKKRAAKRRNRAHAKARLADGKGWS
ncbi:MAG: hypothetical protein ACYC5O_11490 [Anaerolineae bacterium]